MGYRTKAIASAALIGILAAAPARAYSKSSTEVSHAPPQVEVAVKERPTLDAVANEIKDVLLGTPQIQADLMKRYPGRKLEEIAEVYTWERLRVALLPYSRISESDRTIHGTYPVPLVEPNLRLSRADGKFTFTIDPGRAECLEEKRALLDPAAPTLEYGKTVAAVLPQNPMYEQLVYTLAYLQAIIRDGAMAEGRAAHAVIAEPKSPISTIITLEQADGGQTQVMILRADYRLHRTPPNPEVLTPCADAALTPRKP